MWVFAAQRQVIPFGSRWSGTSGRLARKRHGCEGVRAVFDCWQADGRRQGFQTARSSGLVAAGRGGVDRHGPLPPAGDTAVAPVGPGFDQRHDACSGGRPAGEQVGAAPGLPAWSTPSTGDRSLSICTTAAASSVREGVEGGGRRQVYRRDVAGGRAAASWTSRVSWSSATHRITPRGAKPQDVAFAGGAGERCRQASGEVAAKSAQVSARLRRPSRGPRRAGCRRARRQSSTPLSSGVSRGRPRYRQVAHQARQVERPAGLRPGAGSAFAAEGLHADHGADRGCG